MKKGGGRPTSGNVVFFEGPYWLLESNFPHKQQKLSYGMNFRLGFEFRLPSRLTTFRFFQNYLPCFLTSLVPSENHTKDLPSTALQVHWSLVPMNAYLLDLFLGKTKTRLLSNFRTITLHII